MTPKVIRTSLDWFEVSFSGTLHQGVAETLSMLKTRAQSKNAPEPYELGLIEFLVKDKASGFFSYVLKHPEIEIRLAPNAAKGSPNASVRLSAFGLANTEPKLLWEIALACLANLGRFAPLALSRMDVAVDFQGWEPTPLDMQGIVCNALYRATHGTEQGVQTFQFGKGAVVLRVYNKTDELVVSKKAWMHEVWGLTGRYHKNLPVWRAEVQLRSQALRDLGVTCADQVLADPGALMDFGLNWAQLRVPTEDYTKARWPEDPRWTALRKGVFDGHPLQRLPRVSDLMSLDRAKAQYLGAVATAAAYFETDNFMDANMRLSLMVEAHMMSEKIDFAELAETKRRRIMGRL